ncbi:hypothetical protein MdSGHV048 [Musca domestica salivary gland hypertrophy virus]|uniref:Uncharacterized protein n=1 Tax=Musca hytrovirus(isolate Musca domestica/United States/Boucias/-) TaxID=523909 RepID=B2YG25_MHVB|nr:hypothetical protein MdSGHV048 [Musca domestica salivary gland hypertrophy virus]ACD03507.1 hypothetical protein MdSGHV048 [Musca domestica salivary gland hypertrophy virus]
MSRNFAFFLFLGICLVASRVVDCQEGTEDQTVNETQGDQSVNENPGDQSVDEAQGDQSVNENPGDQSVYEAQGDQSVNEVPEDQPADDVADPVPDDQPADDVGSESTNSPHEITEPDASGDGQASEDQSAPTEAPGDQSAPTEAPGDQPVDEAPGASENEKKEEEEEPAVVPDGDGSGDVNNDSNHSNSTEVAVEDNSDHVDDQSENNPGGRDEVPTESPPEDTSAPENIEDEKSKYLGDEYNFFMEHCSPSESVNHFGYELLYDFFINVLHIFYSDHALDGYNSNRTIQKYFGRDVYDQVFNDYANAHSLSEPLMSCPENVEEKFKKSINEFIVHALSTLLTIYYYGTVSADDIQRIEETLSAGQQIDSLIDGYGQMSGVLMDLCRKCH